MDLSSVRNQMLNDIRNNRQVEKDKEESKKRDDKRKQRMAFLTQKTKGLKNAAISAQTAADINQAVNDPKASAGDTAKASVK